MSAPFPSDDPFLQGNFAPWLEEEDHADLPARGEIPETLRGSYYRNGSNPPHAPAEFGVIDPRYAGKASIVTVDVRDVAQVRGLVETAVSETGRLDIMVNNAGLEYPGSTMAGDPAHIADAVLYVVKQPIEVNIADITVRPPKALNLAH